MALVVTLAVVLLCYVDESGDEQALRTESDPPVLVVAGLVVAQSAQKDLVWKFLQLKKVFEPGALPKAAKLSDVIKHEVKGSNLRADIRRTGGRNNRRRAFGFLDGVVGLLEASGASIIGTIYIKADNVKPSKNLYAWAIGDLAKQLEAQLRAASTTGLMILDARTHVKNVASVHSITTQKFRSGGDMLPGLIESPLFGHSDSHVLLQVADLVASALLFPMACAAFCSELGENVHVHSNYDSVRERYGSRLRQLEHRYTDGSGQRRGGIYVSNLRNTGGSVSLYTPAKQAPPLTQTLDVPLAEAPPAGSV